MTVFEHLDSREKFEANDNRWLATEIRRERMDKVEPMCDVVVYEESTMRVLHIEAKAVEAREAEGWRVSLAEQCDTGYDAMVVPSGLYAVGDVIE